MFYFLLKFLLLNVMAVACGVAMTTSYIDTVPAEENDVAGTKSRAELSRIMKWKSTISVIFAPFDSCEKNADISLNVHQVAVVTAVDRIPENSSETKFL